MAADAGKEDPAVQPWVQCDRCSKWRRVPKAVVDSLGDDDAWYCDDNPDKAFATCEVAQELSDKEIDVDLQAAQLAAPPGPSPSKAPAAQRAAAAAAAAAAAPAGAKLPAVWQLISDNIFSHRKRKVQDEDDIMVCQCPPPWRGGDGCGPNCLNRMLCIECTDDFCPCEDKCTNQTFTRKQYAKLAVKRAGPKGFGLYAEEPIKAGQFIIEYIGEVLEEEEYLRRKDYYNSTGQRHYYFMNVGNGEVIDACRKGNPARFINHSCDPNCETQKWLVRGELAIGLFALSDIGAGEELTFDYNFERYGDKPMRCYCGAGKCRKFIGGTQESTADVQAVVEMDDVTYDPEPVMVRGTEVDAAVQAMLDKEVGSSHRAWDDKLIKRLQQLCKSKGIDWSYDPNAVAASLAAARSAAADADADAAAGDEEEEEEDEGEEEEEEEEEAEEEEEDEPAASKRGSKQQQQRAKREQAARERVRAKQQQRARKPKAAPAAAARRRQRRVESSDEEYSATASSDEGEDEGLASDDGSDGAGRASASTEAGGSAGASGDEGPRLAPPKAALKRKRALAAAAAAAAARRRGVPGARGAGRGSDEEMEDADDGAAAGAPAGGALPPRKRLRASAAARGAKPAGAAGDEKKPARRALALLPSMVNVQWRPSFKKRSEVDRRLEGLVNKSTGRLRDQNQDSVIKVLRMFNLCDIAPRTPSNAPPAPGAASPRGADEPPAPQQQQQPQQQQRSPQQQPPQQQQPHEPAAGGGGDEDVPPPPPPPPAEDGAAPPADAPAANEPPPPPPPPAAAPAAAPVAPQQQQQQQAQALTPQQQQALEAERERESEARFRARQRARMHDLGMILDVVLATTSDKVRKEFVSCGMLTQLQQTLGRIPFTQEYAVVLVKVALMLDHLPLTADDLYQARSAHGTFADLLRRMASTAQDWEVRRRAHKLLRRFPASSCSDATLAQLHSLQGPGGKPYLLSLHLPAPQLSRVLASLPPAARQQGPRGRRFRWAGPGPGGFGGRGPGPFGGPPFGPGPGQFGGPPGGFAPPGGFPHMGPPPHGMAPGGPQQQQHFQQQGPGGSGPGGPSGGGEASSPTSSGANGGGHDGSDGRAPAPGKAWPGQGPPPPHGGQQWRGDWGPGPRGGEWGGPFGGPQPADAAPQMMSGNRPLNRVAGGAALDGWDTSGLDEAGARGGGGPPGGPRPVLRANRAMRGAGPGAAGPPGGFGPPGGPGVGPGPGGPIPMGARRGDERWGAGLPPRPASPPVATHRGGGGEWDRERGREREREPPRGAGPGPGAAQLPVMDLDDVAPPQPMIPIMDLDSGPGPSGGGFVPGQRPPGAGAGAAPRGVPPGGRRGGGGGPPCCVEELFASGLYTGFLEPNGAGPHAAGNGHWDADGRASPIVGGGRASPPRQHDGGVARVASGGRLAPQELPRPPAPGAWPPAGGAGAPAARSPGGGSAGGAPAADDGWHIAAGGGGGGGGAPLEFPDSWEAPNANFELFVGETVKRRLGKYVQPDHPNRITREEAQTLYRKLKREVVEKEGVAYQERSRGGQFAPIERLKLENNIKEFVRLSIRRLRAV